jgi:DNA-binding protein Fis
LFVICNKKVYNPRKNSLIIPDSLPQGLRVFHIETLEPDSIKTINNLSRDYAEKVLEMFGGNKSKATEVLGISRASLWRILKK